MTATEVVTVAPPACRPPWYEHSTLEQLLLAETSSRSRAHVAVRVPDCDRRPNTVTVEITYAPGLARTEAIPLGDVPSPVRLRTLALALAELIATPPPPLPPPPPAPPHRPVVPSPRIEAPTPTRRSELRFAAAFSVRALPKHRHALVGGGGTLDIGPFASLPIAISIGLAGEAGRTRAELGDVGVRTIWANVGVDLVINSDALRFGAGPHLEVGWVFLSGSAATSEVTEDAGDGPVALLAIRALLAYAVTEWLSAALAVEVGGTLRGFEATVNARPVAGVAGLAITSRLSIGYVF